MSLNIRHRQALGPRDTQEDAFGSSVYQGSHLLVIADGVGGQNGGAEASQAAVAAMTYLHGQGKLPLDGSETTRLVRTQMRNLIGSTTLTAVQWVSPTLLDIWHAGDSRAYVVERAPAGAQVRCLTEDHNMAYGIWAFQLLKTRPYRGLPYPTIGPRGANRLTNAMSWTDPSNIIQYRRLAFARPFVGVVLLTDGAYNALGWPGMLPANYTDVEPNAPAIVTTLSAPVSWDDERLTDNATMLAGWHA